MVEKCFEPPETKIPPGRVDRNPVGMVGLVGAHLDLGPGGKSENTEGGPLTVPTGIGAGIVVTLGVNPEKGK